MKLTRQLQKIILFLYILAKFGSVKLAYTLSYYNISINNLKLITKEGNYINFLSNANKVSIPLLASFDFSINHLFSLIDSPLALVTKSDEDGFLISINGMSFMVNSLSNMAVLYELFIERIYEVSLNNSHLVVIDIGMNVGTASIYFANMDSVDAVYGYEPFPDTFNEAVSNIARNEHLSNKIKPFNIGVSDITCEKNISLFDSGLLSASTLDISANYGKVANKHITVKLIGANELLSEVSSAHPNSSILLKIDCEGEEYGIFDMLKTTNYLDKVDCILLEWHEKGVESLAAILKSKGFQYFHAPNDKLESGMLYAFRLN